MTMDEQSSQQHLARILVVDDRPENLLVMDRLLKPLDAKIHKVDSGEKALSEVLQYDFAVILLDVQMPGIDGFETASLLHSNKETANIPIIFVTAINKDQSYISKGYEAGAVDYLAKPIIPEILLSKVKVFLKLEEQRLALKQVTEELKVISQKNKLLLDCAGEGIAGLDTEGNITFINPAACELLGGAEKELINMHISHFLFEGGEEQELASWVESDIYKDCMEKGGVLHKSGELVQLNHNRFPVDLHVAALVGDRKAVNGAVLIFQDITERKKLEEKLIRMAKYDSLTGLANRSLFREFLTASMARSDRRHKSTAVMFLDLDHFKNINDELGHDAGDRLLISVAKRVKGCVRDGDMVARLGGDEFAIVLDDVAKPEDARIVAETILKDLEKPHDLGTCMEKVGTSIGIAAYPQSCNQPDELIKAADEAMYIAKNSGRNDYRFYSNDNSTD